MLAGLRKRMRLWRGRINFGQIGGTRPHSYNYGFEFGQPVDRPYIGQFLQEHGADIHGRVLEVGDSTYTRAFGGSRVTQADVLDVHRGNAKATVIGDLSVAGTLPEGAFDAIILTQVMQFLYDLPTAVRQIHHALKPGGVALVTLPGISQIERDEWAYRHWYWNFAPAGATELFTREFGDQAVETRLYGNAYAATAFLQGLAVEQVNQSKLLPTDPYYPVIIAVRAVRSAAG